MTCGNYMNEFCEDKLQMDWQVKTGDHTVR